MTDADQILAINSVLQEYMRARGIRTMSTDEAAQLVYDAGIMAPSSPPGAAGFAFRDFLRQISKRNGYDALHALVGVTQAGSRPQGRYLVHRFDPPSKETIEDLLSSTSVTSPQGSPTPMIPDYLQEGLDVVFVGTSSGEEPTARYHYYADPHDQFWDLVNESELVSDIVGAENDYLILDEKCGLTNLTDKNSTCADASSDRTNVDVDGFILKMERCKPKIVAFNGQRAYWDAFKKDPKGYGLADDIIGESYVFVLPSSSGKDTTMTYQQKLHWYKKLKGTLRTL